MPTREYYDRDAPCPDDRLVPASRDAQDCYHYLRSNLTQAIARNWAEICATIPEIRDAHSHLRALLEDNPHTPFDIFRPEDALFTDQAGSPVFLR